MRVLLILNRKNLEGVRVLVNVSSKALCRQVISLLEANRGRDAFELLIKKGQVEAYLPVGKKEEINPTITLIEDYL